MSATESLLQARLLNEDEKWGKPIKDDCHGSVRPRIACQVGPRSNPYMCANWATWLVGKKKLCTVHAAQKGGK